MFVCTFVLFLVLFGCIFSQCFLYGCYHSYEIIFWWCWHVYILPLSLAQLGMIGFLMLALSLHYGGLAFILECDVTCFASFVLIALLALRHLVWSLCVGCSLACLFVLLMHVFACLVCVIKHCSKILISCRFTPVFIHEISRYTFRSFVCWTAYHP